MSLKTLIVYGNNNRKYWENVYGKEGNLFFNTHKTTIDTLQGMRFDNIIFEEGSTEQDKEILNKYLLSEEDKLTLEEYDRLYGDIEHSHILVLDIEHKLDKGE